MQLKIHVLLNQRLSLPEIHLWHTITEFPKACIFMLTFTETALPSLFSALTLTRNYHYHKHYNHHLCYILNFCQYCSPSRLCTCLWLEYTNCCLQTESNVLLWRLRKLITSAGENDLKKTSCVTKANNMLDGRRAYY